MTENLRFTIAAARAFIAIGIATFPLCAAEPKFDPLLPYQAEKSSPVVYDVDYSIVVTAPYKTKLLQVWLPLPQSDAGQEVESKSLTSFPAEAKPQVASEQVFGNRFAYFEIHDPQGAQILRHQFR